MAEEHYIPADRRPIKSREKAVFQWLAGKLVKSGVTANAISIAGMVSGIASGLLLAGTNCGAMDRAGWMSRLAWLGGAAFVQLRLLANMLDGMVALASAKASQVGELYNEIPDRVSDTAILVGAGYAFSGVPWLGWAAAAAAMFTAYIRAVGKTMGVKDLFMGPMAKQQRMFLMTLVAVAMAILPVTWQLEWQGMGWVSLVLAIITAGSVLTAARRLGHIVHQVRGST